ncbi:CemA family protein [Gloeomargarita sp.]
MATTAQKQPGGWQGWLLRRALHHLERAYRAAQRLKTLEERYGHPLPLQFPNDPAKARYLQGILDRQLLTIRLHMVQFRALNFLADYSELPWEEEQQILQKLAFIEQRVSPYRQQAQPSASISSHEGVPTSQTAASRRANQDSGSFMATVLEISRELQPGYEEQVVQEIRLFRQQGRTAIRFLVVLLTVPLLTQILTKNIIFTPLLDRFVSVNPEHARPFLRGEIRQEAIEEFVRYKELMEFTHLLGLNPEFSTKREETLQEKALEIFRKHAYRAVDGLANLLADLSGLLAFLVVARLGRGQFPILWGFIDRFFRSLNDPTKVFIFILVTDLFVGFHSVEGWEVLLETLSHHFGITPNRSAIYTFIATVPVILDAAIKFWIFNYLSRSSPSSVAVLEKMNQ